MVINVAIRLYSSTLHECHVTNLTDGGHDGDGEEERFCNGPRVGPVTGGVVAVLGVVASHKNLHRRQISPDLE